MKRFLLFATITFVACTSAPPPRVAPPPPTPQPAQSSNALSAMPRAIAEPRIRVGMLSDQSSFKFDRIDGGYAISGVSGMWSLRRGFMVTAPLQNAPVRYAVQVSAISDKESATDFVQKLQTETGQRADMVFDPSASNGGIYRILVGDFPDSKSANPLRDQLAQR